MTDSPLDGPPQDGLDGAFALPDYLADDDRLSRLFGEVVQRLRNEALGLPMGTVQQLLIERIAYIYVFIKHREATGQWTPAQQKDFNTYWLSLTAEFNKQLNTQSDKLREALLNDINGVVMGAVEMIKDDDTRRAVRRHLAEGFAALEV